MTLTGAHIRLEPLAESHAEDLLAAAQDPDIWRWMPIAGISSLEAARLYIRDAWERAQGGTEVPFASVSVKTGRAIGSTRYLNIRPSGRGLEIGWTWLSTAHHRTAVNTECKYMLLRHAFEVLRCLRVEFKTDILNMRSQRAIERLGAVREGVFRHQMVRPDGSLRDSVYYSILVGEWPEVRARLEASLKRG